MLEVKGLSKSFDGFLAVNKATLEVSKGEIGLAGITIPDHGSGPAETTRLHFPRM